MRLKEHGTAQLRLDREHRRVEALQMAGLEDAVVLLRKANEFVGLRERGGEGFLDEQVQTGFKEHRSGRMMEHGGHRNRGRVYAKIPSEQFFDRSKYRDGVICLGFRGTRSIRFDGGDKRDARPGRFKFTINAKVIAAEGAGSDDGNA